MANRYFLNIGVNWGDTANWSDTSGGTGGFSVPTNVDDVFFDANSGNCTINATNRNAKSIDATGYINKLTITFNITVAGNVTLGAGMTIEGSGDLILNTNCNLTSNGVIWSGNIRATSSGSQRLYTLIDDWTILGNYTQTGIAGIDLGGLFTLYVGGNLTITTSSFSASANATIRLNGTGTWSGAGNIRNNIIIDKNSNILLDGAIRFSTGTLTCLSDKVKLNNTSLIIAQSSTFIDCDKINFESITITAGTTQTFNKFFSGSAIQPTRISSTGANYTISFQDNFEKITKFTKISNCTVSNRGQLLCLTNNSNKGGNLGVRYINQLPNGVPKNAPTVAAAMAYSVANISDPNFILN